MNCPNGLQNPCPNSVTGVSSHLFLTLINTLLATQCTFNPQEKYPADYSNQIQDNEEFDFIIIGSGAGGSVVANKLTENPDWKVLVLEAGTYPSSTSEIPGLLFSLQDTNEDWQYKTEPSDTACLSFKDQTCKWPRGKGLGGSGLINAMLYIRGKKQDYDNWSECWMGNEGWNWDNIEKYFKEIENFQDEKVEKSTNYGRKGYQTLKSYNLDEPIKNIILEAAKELGYQTLGEEKESDLGYFEGVLTSDGIRRQNPAVSFLGKIKNRSNLFVATNAHVEKLVEIEPKDFRKVQVKIGDRKLNLVAKKEVIVSAGTINSPQLLMLSGIGPKDHLKDLGIEPIVDLPVGKNLQDHFIFLGFYVSVSNSTTTFKPPYQIIDELYNYFMHQKGALGTISLTNLIGFISTQKNSNYPNIQIHHVLFPQNERYLLPEILRATGIQDEISKIKFEANKQANTLSLIPTLLKPKSTGEILLKTQNPYDKPLIYANYLQESDDLETMLEGIRYLENVVKTEPFREQNAEIVDLKIKNCENLLFRSDDYWKCALKNLGTTIYHPVGTCKMGPKTDADAVVDSRLRVHGVKNLRVIDASVMPDITSGNTHAPTLMIGQKGGSMIQEDWNYVQSHQEL